MTNFFRGFDRFLEKTIPGVRAKCQYPIWVGLGFGLIGAGVERSGFGTLLFHGRYPILAISILLALPGLFRKNPVQFAVHGLLIAGVVAGLWQGSVFLPSRQAFA